MQSLSEPRRPPDASAAAERGGAEAAPRRRLIVEIYSPEPVARAAPVARKWSGKTALPWRRDLSANLTRSIAAIVVVGIHALAISGILFLTQTQESAPAPAAPLEVFGITRRPLISLAEIGASLPQPEPPQARTVAARMPSLAIPAGATEIAITISGSTAVVIGEANPAEVASVERNCGAARIEETASRPRAADVTLLVRVDKDGRVTDTRVEAGSGVSRIDDSARACLREHGLLTPQRVHGASVASWQRVHWSAS
ncbi:MAG: energy transducer TonB [Steroidobacteraceae bacterium]|jgi:hypothetical protein